MKTAAQIRAEISALQNALAEAECLAKLRFDRHKNNPATFRKRGLFIYLYVNAVCA